MRVIVLVLVDHNNNSQNVVKRTESTQRKNEASAGPGTARSILPANWNAPIISWKRKHENGSGASWSD